MDNINIDGTRMIIAMAIGIVFLIYMILRTKIHTFPALIIAAIFVGIAGGMTVDQVIGSVTEGFGSTLGSIGIIIGFGVMMGEIFERSGAAKRMAYTILDKLGHGKEEVAMGITGFLVSIPIFCDSGFVILTPLIKALSRQTKKSIVTLGIALASGLVITHTMIPPTPGPVGAAGIFGANVGSVILWGIVIAVPMLVATLAYARYMNDKIYQIPDEGDGWIRPDQRLAPEHDITAKEDEILPSTLISFAPIFVPIILILLKTTTDVIGVEGILGEVITLLGTPIVAVGLGLLVAIFTLTGSMERQETLDTMENGIKSAGTIILITGGGGAFGQVLRNSGVGEYIANFIAQTPIPALFLPFLIATLMRFIQGSGTVAMLTSASMTAPIMASLGVNPVFATLSACIGSLFFSYFSDSFFWVVNRSIGITDAKEQMRVWSIPTTIAWGVGFIALLIINALFG